MSSSYFTTTLSPYCMHKDISEPFHPFYLVPLHGHLSKKTEDILLNAVFVFSFAEFAIFGV